MNIKPKYQPGILLKPGKYDIEVTCLGYESKRQWVKIDNANLTFDVILNQIKNDSVIDRKLDDKNTEHSLALLVNLQGFIEMGFVSGWWMYSIEINLRRMVHSWVSR